jgi:hypothetical protein
VIDAMAFHTVVPDGNKGVTMLANADCAEDFDVSTGQQANPKTVMVFGPDASLRISDASSTREAPA